MIILELYVRPENGRHAAVCYVSLPLSSFDPSVFVYVCVCLFVCMCVSVFAATGPFQDWN